MKLQFSTELQKRIQHAPDQLCVAVCGSVWQCVAACVGQCVAVCGYGMGFPPLPPLPPAPLPPLPSRFTPLMHALTSHHLCTQPE